MAAEKWMRHLRMVEEVRKHVRAKEHAEAAEQERTRQEAQRRAWLRELGQAAGVSAAQNCIRARGK
jgi:hypothetical protein